MKILLLIAALSSPNFAQANEEESFDSKAIAEAQAILRNPQALKGPAGNPDEKAALAEIDKLTKGDPKITKEINQLSSDIFTDMAKKSGDNEDVIMKSLLEAQKNPAMFMQSLSPEQRRQLRELAGEIDENNTPPKK